MTEPQALVDAALGCATTDGCVVIVDERSEANLRWAANALTTNGQMRSRTMTVIATADRRSGTSVGVTSRSISTMDEVESLVRAAEQTAYDAEPADDASPLIEATDAVADWDEPPATTDVDTFAEFAGELGETCAQWRAADRLLFGFAEQVTSSVYLATSTGVRRRHVQSDGRLELNGKSGDLARSAWSGTHAQDFAAVDVAAAADALITQLDWAATRIELPAGRYETILPPSAVADLMISAYWSASDRDAREGRNVYSGPGGGTRIGERLTRLPLQLRSDPTAAGMRCAPFEIVTASDGSMQSVFDNGAPTAATSWITDGYLSDLIRTRAWASESGQQPRPYVDNLILECTGSQSSLADMIASTERGLLLTCLWYIREVDPQTLLMTGLTRDGVYLVEDGQVRGAVNNFRFNESPVDLLTRTTEVGRSVHTLSREWNDYFQRTAMPPMRIPDFNMSTVSQAS